MDGLAYHICVCVCLCMKVVPSSVWQINTDPAATSEGSVSFGQEDKWWDQVDLVKLILAANQIKEIPEDIRLLCALTVLDVSPILYL